MIFWWPQAHNNLRLELPLPGPGHRPLRDRARPEERPENPAGPAPTPGTTSRTTAPPAHQHTDRHIVNVQAHRHHGVPVRRQRDGHNHARVAHDTMTVPTITESSPSSITESPQL